MKLPRVFETVFQLILLIHVVMFYSCYGHWISRYWIIASRINTEWGFYKSLVTTFLSTNNYITLFYMFPFKDNLMYIVDSLILKSQPMARYVMPEQRPSSTHFFLHNAHHRLLALRNTRLHFSITLILNNRITKKYKNVISMTVKRLQKGHPHIVWEMKWQQSIASSHLSWKHMCWATQYFCRFVYLGKSPWMCGSINFSKEENVQILNPRMRTSYCRVNKLRWKFQS